MRLTRPAACVLLVLFLCGQQVVAQTTFTDTAPATGTDTTSYGRASVMVDFDGDGLLDLVAANDYMINHFYRQLPDHTFVLANDEWGIPPHNRHTWGILAADFDNDGDDDVYIINLGYPGERNQLLRNDLNTLGVFTDVSLSSGDAPVYRRNFSGTALDYNNDGLLDIFLTSPAFHNYLLRNDGNLVFTDVSAAAGFVEEDAFRHCSSGDFNNDGWIDIAVGNYTGPNYLYKNNGDGTFTNVAADAGIESPGYNFGLVLEDFDNDGWQDIWAPKYFLEVPSPGTSEMFRNNGDGSFSNVTAAAQMTGQTDMGHTTGDVDGDGYPDIYIGTGHPGFKSFDILLHVEPDGQGGFATTDMSDSSGITSNGETRCHGMALGDYDQDGFIDIYVNNGGPPTDPEEQLQENFLWRGQDNGSHWVAVQLTGVASNRTAVGTRAVAVTNTGREVHRILRVGHGFANTDSHILHFGIGSDESVERIVIKWPSGTVQTIFDPAMGQTTNVTEPSGNIQAGQVPNGDGVSGTPLTVSRAGEDITLTWSASCTTTDSDYDVYEGTLGDFASHEPRFCSTGGQTTWTLTPSEGNTYYLVVPRNSVWEGSFGTDSGGNQRPRSENACLGQSFESCSGNEE